MTDNRYYIAKDNYSVSSEDGRSIDVSVGNQFVLIEDLHNDQLKLKCIDSSLSDLAQIILPCNILENMSTPTSYKPALILRSQSSIKERICSLNLNDNVNAMFMKSKSNTIGHGTITGSISPTMFDSKRSQTLPSNLKPQPELRSSIKTETDEVEVETNDVEAETNEVEKEADEVDNVTVMEESITEGKWKCVLENEREVYIDMDTGERWHVAMDDMGRQYYYSEVTLQSVWVLPGNSVLDDISIGEEAVRHIEDVLEGLEESSDKDEDFEGNDAEKGIRTSNVPMLPAAPTSVYKVPDIQDNGSRFSIKYLRKEHISGPLFNKLMRSEKSGSVEKTKLSENGKEVPKKWATFHAVLTGPELLFYKDLKAVAVKPGMPQGKVELKLKIQNLEFTEKTEAGNKCSMLVLEDKGAPGSNITYLLRYNSTEEVLAWKAALQYAKNWQNENMYTDNAFKSELSPVDDVSGDKQNIGIKLKLFLKKRPSRESLEASGILKLESVFGSSLSILCEQEQSKVPEFVFRCILAIEARGLHHNGLYRISGNQAKIQKLRLAVDENKYQLNSEFVELETLTGALKSFFKELREPLFDDDFCKKMVDILSRRKSDKKNPYGDINPNNVKKVLSKLKPSHYETTKVLLAHLEKVAALSKNNLMDISNLSMVWGPNLYLVSGQASAKLAITLMTHNQIVDYLLTFYSELFGKT